jgi:hypothetical protein
MQQRADNGQILKELLGHEVPIVFPGNYQHGKLVPVFSKENGFSKDAVEFEIHKLKRENEIMLSCLRGELSPHEARLDHKFEKRIVLEKSDSSDACWKVWSCVLIPPLFTLSQLV